MKKREGHSGTVSQGTLHTLSEFIHTLIYQNYKYSVKKNYKQHFYNFIKQLGKKTDLLMMFLIIHFDVLKYCLT